MLEIDISPKAKAYILKKSGNVTLDIVRSGGWGGFTFKPAVFAGKPERAEFFRQHDVDGVTVFVTRKVGKTVKRIEILMTGWGPLRCLEVEGLIWQTDWTGMN